MEMAMKHLSPQRVEDDYELEPRVVRAAFNRGELKASFVGRRLFVERAELERWISAKEQKRKERGGVRGRK